MLARMLTTVLCVMALSVLSAGCSTVTVNAPLTATPTARDVSCFEGVWLMDKETLTIRFDKNGVGQVGAAEFKDDKFQLFRAEIYPTHGQYRRFLALRLQENGQWLPDYYLVQYDFTDQGELLIWQPELDAFATLVNAKKLQGEVKLDGMAKEVRLTSPGEMVLKALDTPGLTGLFRYQKPSVLRRVAGPAVCVPEPLVVILPPTPASGASGASEKKP